MDRRRILTIAFIVFTNILGAGVIAVGWQDMIANGFERVLILDSKDDGTEDEQQPRGRRSLCCHEHHAEYCLSLLL